MPARRVRGDVALGRVRADDVNIKISRKLWNVGPLVSGLWASIGSTLRTGLDALTLAPGAGSAPGVIGFDPTPSASPVLWGLATGMQGGIASSVSGSDPTLSALPPDPCATLLPDSPQQTDIDV